MRNKSFYLSRITRFTKKSYLLLFFDYKDELHFQLLRNYFSYVTISEKSSHEVPLIPFHVHVRSTNRVAYSRTAFYTLLFFLLTPSPRVNRATRSKRSWRNSKRNEAYGPLVFDSTFREINPRPRL